MSLFELGTDGPGSILVGLDDSVTSTRAAWYAAGLARRQRARVTAVHVVRPAIGIAVASSAVVAVARREAAAQLADDMRRGAEELFGEWGVPVTFMAPCGDPFTELCRIAADIRADAVVVGVSTRVARRLAGSLAVRLVKAGKWPVTVVP